MLIQHAFLKRGVFLFKIFVDFDAMNFRNEVRCARCVRQTSLTEHHIYPQCHYNGEGPRVWLCDRCHPGIEKEYAKHESDVTRRRGDETRVDIGPRAYWYIWVRYRDSYERLENDPRREKTKVRGSRGETLIRRNKK
jgi:hypothetical protein